MATAVVRVLSRLTAYDRAVTEAVLRALIETCREDYGTVGRPIVQSCEPGENRRWCYVDETIV